MFWVQELGSLIVVMQFLRYSGLFNRRDVFSPIGGEFDCRDVISYVSGEFDFHNVFLACLGSLIVNLCFLG